MAEARKRMHIHLIDAAINLRAKGYQVRVYPRCEVYAAGRLVMRFRHFYWRGNEVAGWDWCQASISLDTFNRNPRYWRWITNLPWLMALHHPANIIPRRNCQLSSLDLAAANHSVGTNQTQVVASKQNPVATFEQLSLGI